MRLPEEPESPFQINIIPMIDVIFAILAFFIMSSLFLARSTGLPINLPTAQTAQPQLARSQTIALSRTGELRLNNQPVTLSSLPSRLKAVTGTQVTLVIIQADRQVEHGNVVAVMDKLRQLPNIRMAIAAKQ